MTHRKDSRAHDPYENEGPGVWLCQWCHVNWPYEHVFRSCPRCGQQCRVHRLLHAADKYIVIPRKRAHKMLEAAGPDQPLHAQKPDIPKEPHGFELKAVDHEVDFWAKASGPDDYRIWGN